MSLVIFDKKGSFLHDKNAQEIALELPPEDPRRDHGTHVGLSNKSMNGARDALIIWQDHIHGLFDLYGGSRNH